MLLFDLCVVVSLIQMRRYLSQMLMRYLMNKVPGKLGEM